MVDIFYPFQWFADLITYNLFNLAKDSSIASSVNFIIYDIFKIFFLLAVMIFAVSLLRTYITPEKTRKYLSGKKGILYHFLASLVGVVTPFCSCSSIPLFIGFIEAGVPLGITFSFLITSPLVNAAAVAVLLGIFGIEITLLYIISGILIGVIGGYIIQLLKMEKYVADFVYKLNAKEVQEKKQTMKERISYAKNETKSIVSNVWIYIIIGVAIGGLFHGYAPENMLQEYASPDNFLAVPISVLIGVPLYSNVIGMIPIVESLVGKGLPLGTALAFLMSVTALSLPSIIILKKVLKKELIILFVTIVTLSIIFIGYLFNFII